MLFITILLNKQKTFILAKHEAASVLKLPHEMIGLMENILMEDLHSREVWGVQNCCQIVVWIL